MKLFKKYSFLTIILILFTLNNLWAVTDSEKISELIKYGKQEIYRYHFANALRIVQSIQQKYPDLPHGYFYEAYLTTILYYHDETNDSLEARFLQTVQNSVNISEIYAKQNKRNPEAFFFLGVSHGLFGVYHVMNRNYFKGYLNGRRGKNYLEEVIRIDSTYYDAYLGLGIYHYYVDLLPGIVKFFAKILGFSGDREEGLAEILLTRNKGNDFSVEAEFTYAAVRYFLEGAKSEALSILFQLKSKYPSNPTLALFIGYYFRRLGQVETALEYFQEISDQYIHSLPLIYLMKNYNLGVCTYRQNNFSTSETIFRNLFESPVRKSVYYEAAIAYYLARLAALRFDQNYANAYLSTIRNEKKTQYWYNVSRIHTKIEMDSLFYYYILISNDIFTANFSNASNGINKIKSLTDNSLFNIKNITLNLLIQDLEARYAFRRGRINDAFQKYKGFISDVDKIGDEFQKAWIYIQYARVLRELKEWYTAEEYLKKASNCEDDYTKLIVERERFIIKESITRTKKQEKS